MGLLAAGFFIAGCGSESNPPEPPIDVGRTAVSCEALAPLFTPLVDERWITGAAVVLIDARAERHCGFGKADGADAPVTADTFFEIGSVTKTFTGVLLASMALDGMVELDEPVSALLDRELSVLSYEGRPITLAHLATHRSMLPRMPYNFSPADPTNPYVDYDEARLLAYLSEARLNSTPGGRYLYSNLGAGLLGHALAVRAGVPYSALLEERVLLPLGLSDTRLTIPEELRARTAQAFDADAAPTSAWDFDVLAPAGGLRSTAEDMGRFVSAALGTGPSSVGPAIELAETARADADGGLRIGLFFHVRPDGVIWHNGGTGGFRSYVAIDRERQLGVAVLLSTAFAHSDALGDRIFELLRGAPLEPLELPATIALEAARLAEYEAIYRLEEDVVLRVFAEGPALKAQVTGQSAVRLWPSAPDQFHVRVVEASVSFERDADASIVAAILDQNGLRTRAPRE